MRITSGSSLVQKSAIKFNLEKGGLFSKSTAFFIGINLSVEEQQLLDSILYKLLVSDFKSE